MAFIQIKMILCNVILCLIFVKFTEPSPNETTKKNVSSNSSNPNQDICDMLRELAAYEDTVSSKTHISIAYRKAANILANLTTRVTSGKEARQIRGIGMRIGVIIDEILETGKLKLIDEARKDKNCSDAMRDLRRVTGIGPAKARSLYNQGIINIELLSKNQDQLSRHQKLGLKYVYDFEKKIPRSEVSEIEQIIKKALKKFDPLYEITICGSYRRGLKFSGDIDALITHPSYTSKMKSNDTDVKMKKIVDVLIAEKLITGTLAVGEKKFMGVCKVHEISRRLDIRLNPYDQYYCAVLYFTGSGLFNTQMREHARNQGFVLNEYTLSPKTSSGTGKPLTITSEQDIFKNLNYPYKKPEDRDIH